MVIPLQQNSYVHDLEAGVKPKWVTNYRSLKGEEGKDSRRRPLEVHPSQSPLGTSSSPQQASRLP